MCDFLENSIELAENNPESYILGHAANARLISTGFRPVGPTPRREEKA